MFPNKIQLISHHEYANQTHGKWLDTRGCCPTFTGLAMPLVVTYAAISVYAWCLRVGCNVQMLSEWPTTGQTTLRLKGK